MQQTRIDDMAIAKDIFLHITSPTRLSCGVREAKGGSEGGRPFLLIRVGGSTHKDYVKIVLNRNNKYALTHMRVFDVAGHTQVFAEISDIYPGELSHMLSKVVKAH